MGKGEQVIKRSLARRGAALIVLGAILALGMGFLALALAVVGEYGGMLVFVLLTALGAFCLAVGIKECSIRTSGWTARNPDLSAQADELYENAIYEDKYILHSEKHIGSKRTPPAIAAFDEVLGMYVRKTRYNFLITVQKQLIIVTQKGEIALSIYSDQKIDELARRIAAYSPRARFGYTADNLAYFRAQQKAYKEYLKAARRR